MDQTNQPRKRPRQARSAATVANILEAAARILETTGPAGFTTNAVARVAGVSIGSLYQYFPTKEVITRELIARSNNELLVEIRKIASEGPPRNRLERILEAAVALQLRRPALARLLDQLEKQLPIVPDRDTNEALIAIITNCIQGAGFSCDPNVESLDVIAIVKSIVDAAGERDETDQLQLSIRVKRAVFGYLREPVSVQNNDWGRKQCAPLSGCHGLMTADGGGNVVAVG
ncbi:MULTISPECIES: TetR/AcrR family transcriptional regulator [Rhizobium/Agrobacterium group]|nr:MULTISPECIES: TetR/AcrR family transcriptional regulator [Rhizobium/Agrobacterium group]